MAKALCKYCGKSWAEKELHKGIACPMCMEAGNWLPKPEPKKVAEVYQDKSISSFGWFWEYRYQFGWALTRRGAVRKVKRYVRKKSLGVTNKFKVEI